MRIPGTNPVDPAWAGLEVDGRIVPIDILRGAVMLLLVGEATGLYNLLLNSAADGTVLHSIGVQFTHHPWHGLRLWDFGQPLFMFISGVAMVFAYDRRHRSGESPRASWTHVLSRSFVLFTIGWALSHIKPMENGANRLFFIDVLPQLAFANVIAFWMSGKRFRSQVLFGMFLLVLTESLYRFWPIPGFDQAFVPGHNFGSFVDLSLFGQLSEGHWVTFNVIPASVHTIMGSLVGQFLMRSGIKPKVLNALTVTGSLCLISGLLLGAVTPIIKRISTSSFILLTGGVSILVLVLCFRMSTCRVCRKWSRLFSVVGMNPLLIYTVALSGGGDWLRHLSYPFIQDLAGWSGSFSAQLLLGLVVWAELWLVCHWLYKKRIFVKI